MKGTHNYQMPTVCQTSCRAIDSVSSSHLLLTTLRLVDIISIDAWGNAPREIKRVSPCHIGVSEGDGI